MGFDDTRTTQQAVMVALRSAVQNALHERPVKEGTLAALRNALAVPDITQSEEMYAEILPTGIVQILVDACHHSSSSSNSLIDGLHCLVNLTCTTKHGELLLPHLTPLCRLIENQLSGLARSQPENVMQIGSLVCQLFFHVAKDRSSVLPAEWFLRHGMVTRVMELLSCARVLDALLDTGLSYDEKDEAGYEWFFFALSASYWSSDEVICRAISHDPVDQFGQAYWFLMRLLQRCPVLDVFSTEQVLRSMTFMSHHLTSRLRGQLMAVVNDVALVEKLRGLLTLENDTLIRRSVMHLIAQLWNFPEARAEWGSWAIDGLRAQWSLVSHPDDRQAIVASKALDHFARWCYHARSDGDGGVAFVDCLVNRPGILGELIAAHQRMNVRSDGKFRPRVSLWNVFCNLSTLLNASANSTVTPTNDKTDEQYAAAILHCNAIDAAHAALGPLLRLDDAHDKDSIDDALAIFIFLTNVCGDIGTASWYARERLLVLERVRPFITAWAVRKCPMAVTLHDSLIVRPGGF